jgi:hypothetical protein
MNQTNREWGDFQTPLPLAMQVCRYLAASGVAPRVVIEPTCGTGNFILAALQSFPTVELVYGVEIQEKYYQRLKTVLLPEALRGRRAAVDVELRHDDIFMHPFPSRILNAQEVLILGNPPWVTNAELGALDANNLPAKRNLKSLNGLDALTGKSNFDLGEFVLLRLLDLFSERRGTLAMLCKNSVIRRMVEMLPQRRHKVSNLRALEIDAQREFSAAVDASLLVMDLGASQPEFTCQVATLVQPHNVTRRFGWTRHKFVSNVDDYESNAELDGASPFVWRQGLKHDCARIMELDERDGRWVNGDGEAVDVEDEYVFSLLKSSDLRVFEVKQVRKKVIVTQRQIGEDTAHLQKDAPKLWAYLTQRAERFEKRKSSIYRNRPRFSMFGVGDYSFKPYKVAIAGLYKEPRFSIVPPIGNRPVMLDDTCYFLGFDDYHDALWTASLLNSPLVKRFLRSIVFVDAKRPYTKGALMRIDLTQAARVLFEELRRLWMEVGYAPRLSVSEKGFEDYMRRLRGKRQVALQLSFLESV